MGIEWMRVHPASRAVAIEPRADRRMRIVRNACALGVLAMLFMTATISAASALMGKKLGAVFRA